MSLAYRILKLSCLVLSGCAGIAPSDETLDSALATSAKILIVGDTQEHAIEGLPIGALNGFIDNFADVTIRPSQHALYGRKLFELVAKENYSGGKLLPVIHLGDLLDHSCEIEFQRQKKILLKLQSPFYLAPGNHDGIYQGVFNPADSNSNYLFSQVGWDYACRTPSDVERAIDDNTLIAGDRTLKVGEISKYYDVEVFREDSKTTTPRSHLLSKDRLIELYKELLQERNAISDKSCIKPGLDICVEDVNSRNVRLYGKIVRRKPKCEEHSNCEGYIYSNSFLVQVIDISDYKSDIPFKLILLDTTQIDFQYRPFWYALFHFGRNPGSQGAMGQNQLEIVRELVKEARDKGEVVILAGHHDWAHLSQFTRQALAAIYDEMSHGAVYLSAHTHNGFLNSHPLGTRKLLEFNVSSLADWPIDARMTSFRLGVDKKTIEVVSRSVIGATGVPLTSDDISQGIYSATCGHPQVAELMSSGETEDFVSQQRKVASSHHRERARFDTIIASLILRLFNHNSDTERWFSYKDNFNDNRKAIESFILLLTSSDKITAWVESQSIPIRTGYKRCEKLPLIERLNCSVAESYKDAKTLKREYIMDKPLSGGHSFIRESYEAISQTVLDIQKVIDETSMSATPGIVRLMACAHYLAAEQDWKIRTFTSKINTHFFRTSALARVP